MTNKFTLVALILIVLVFISGCTQYQTQPSAYSLTAQGEVKPLLLNDSEYNHPDAQFFAELSRVILNSFDQN
jgi:PBP1b-binding outer membrane lipoprotein LpoB